MTRGLMLVMAIAALCAACGDRAASAPTPPPKAATQAPPPAPPPIETVHPALRTRLAVLETSGKVAFNEERLVRVHAPVTGRVVEVPAKPGDVVEPGATLFVIDSPELSAAKADYAKAVVDQERAAKALDLVRELVEAKAVAQKELRDAESEHRKAQAERERAAARLRTLGVTGERLPAVAARTDAGTTVTVTAPRSGVIIERNITPGQVVAYGQADAPLNLFVIADLSTMWVLADVYEPDVPRVRLGQTVTVTLPCCPGERYEGTVTYIADAVDPQSRTLKVRAVVPNRGRALKAEMFAKVTLATTATRVLAVPQMAVHRDQNVPFVLVQSRGTSEYDRRPVSLGADLGDWIEVVKGVTADDTVVTTGGILLKRTVK